MILIPQFQRLGDKCDAHERIAVMQPIELTEIQLDKNSQQAIPLFQARCLAYRRRELWQNKAARG